MAPRRVVLVGLGTIARTHLAVLARRDDVEVVGAVDPRAPADHSFPVFPDLPAALAADLRPDLVVVATPTATHADVVASVLGATDARVLCEKPLVASYAELEELEERIGSALGRVAVAHHFAFSPEVEWARGVVAARPELGPPTRILSVFNDAYGDRLDDRTASLVSTWVDSGPNQLSLLAAFTTGWEVLAHDDRTHRAVTDLRHEGGSTVLTSSWLAADSSKQTTVELAGGAVQVRMDHTSMTGLLLEDGRVVEHAGYTGGLGRKEAHYAGLYDALLTDAGDPRLGVPLAAEIARVLEDAAGAHGGGALFSEVGWSE
ncbi:Gfo/Idh/MocA family protein [Nocardioides panacisoli]|uniref:Gfo/Idh/MocA-like oxidoreductase N-terminal domain-containing protein n=1 Tax=Nocardioides panacisoli TaxID=627624 RepID=A0ABP7IU60_9ACTN